VGFTLLDRHTQAVDAPDAGPSSDAGCLLDDAQGVLPPPPASARWPLDETAGTSAAEATGGAPAGVLMNFADPPAWMPGQVDGALGFDGVDDYVQIGAARSAVKSLAFWAKPSSAASVLDHSAPLFPSLTGPDEEWDSPEKAFSEGDGSATANLNLIGSRSQHWGGFHIPSALPAGATVLGVTVAIKSTSFGVIQGLNVELSWDGGKSHTSANYGGVALVGSSNVSTYGDKDQLWKRTWQAQDFSDENFRVRVTLGGLVSLAVSIDYVSVQIKFSDVADPRDIIGLNESVKVAFVDAQMHVAALSWPGATTYVNGVAGAALSGDWNHVVITSAQAIDVTDLRLGGAGSPSSPFEGLLDDVSLFDEGFLPAQVAVQQQSPECGL